MGLESGGNDFLNKIAAENGSNVRITLIDKDGIVLFDNQAEAKTLENHAMRQEIMEAVAVGAGEAERFRIRLIKQRIIMPYALRTVKYCALHVLLTVFINRCCKCCR